MIKRLFILIVVVCAMIGLTIAQNTLDYGTRIEDNFTAIQTSKIYTFEGGAGDIIYATLIIDAEDVEPELRLFDPSGGIINDSFTWSGMGIISPIELEESGTYTLTAGIDGDLSSDAPFTLLIDRAKVKQVEDGVDYSGILATPNALDFYMFETEEKGLVSYVTDGDNLGYLVYNENGDYWAEEGFWESPFVPLAQLPSTDTYTYIIRTIEEEEDTDYNLSIHYLEATPLTSGTPVTGTTNARGTAVLSFDSLGGKTWELEAMLPENGDRYMFIYQFEEREWWDTRIANDYGSGPNGQPRIGPFTAPIDATYYVLLEFHDYNNQNFVVDYEVTFHPSSVLSLAPGTAISDTANSSTGAKNYVYQGTAGEVIRVTLTLDAGAPAMLMRSSVDNEMEWYANDIREASFVFVLPYDDTYSFTITNDSEEDMNFSLLLEHAK